MLPLSLHVRMVRLSFLYVFLRTINLRSRLTVLSNLTWSKSPDSYHSITPTRVDICPLIVSVEEKQSAQEFQLFFSSDNMKGNQTRFNECSDSDISFYSGF